MELNTIVRTNISGGTLELQHLIRYAKENKTNIIPCDIEAINPQCIENDTTFGVEILTGLPNYSYVIYSTHNDVNKIFAYISELNSLNSTRLHAIFNEIKNSLQTQTNIETYEKDLNISKILSTLVEIGISKNTTDAFYYILPIIKKHYNPQIALDLLKKYDLKYFMNFIKVADNIVEQFSTRQNCLGVIFDDSFDMNKYNIEVCRKNQIPCVLGNGFSSHILKENITTTLNNDYIEECAQKLFG